MENKLDKKQALRVFYKIAENGQKVGEEYRFHDLYASSDIDGYTVTIRDDAVTLYMFFHNTYKFEFKRKIQLEQFMDKIAAVDKMPL